MIKRWIFIFLSFLTLSRAWADRPVVPLTQWVGQLPTTQLTGVDLYHHPDLLPFLQAVKDFNLNQQGLISQYHKGIPVRQLDHYLIIQAHSCGVHGCQWGHTILYDLDKRQAAICQQQLVWVFHSFPSDKPDGKPVASSFQAQILVFQHEKLDQYDQSIRLVEGDEFTGCSNLKAEPAFALQQFFRFYKN